MMVIADAICARMLLSDIDSPAMPTICAMRASASRGLLAWMVAIEPSWPVFMA
jgi:hypothetical protein